MPHLRFPSSSASKCSQLMPLFIPRSQFGSQKNHSESSAMPITYDDLSLRNYRNTDISSRLALFLVGLSVLCSLVGFILCLAGEASRSEATWMVLTIQDSGKGYRCNYSSSGKTPLAFALTAFLLFAVAMFTEHAYMLVAITSPSPPAVIALPVRNDPSAVSPAEKALTCQACFLFLTTWICFAIAEVLLMITIGVESGHLYNWTKPRVTCPAVRPGLFATAGVFGLTTVFLGVALYLTALRTQRLHLEEENMQRQQHVRHTAPPQEPPAIRAHPSQEPRGISSFSRTQKPTASTRGRAWSHSSLTIPGGITPITWSERCSFVNTAANTPLFPSKIANTKNEVERFQEIPQQSGLIKSSLPVLGESSVAAADWRLLALLSPKLS